MAAADGDCKEPTGVDNAGEEHAENRSVCSRSTDSSESGPLNIEFGPTVRRKMTFVEYEPESNKDDRSTLPSRMMGKNTHGSGSISISIPSSNSSETSSSGSNRYLSPSRSPRPGPPLRRTEPQDLNSIMAALHGAMDTCVGVLVSREKTALLDAIEKLKAFAEDQEGKHTSLVQSLGYSESMLEKLGERAAESLAKETSLKMQVASLEQEKDGYWACMSDLREGQKESKRQIDYFRMQNLGAEALESARLEVVATEKLKVSEAEKEEMKAEIERLRREIKVTKIDLDAVKNQGVLGSSSPGLSLASQIMAENEKLKEDVYALTKDLAEVQKAHDTLLDDIDQESLNSGGDGDSSDMVSSKLSLVRNRVSQLEAARRDIVLRMTYAQLAVNGAVRDGDAAMERQKRDEERKLSVLADMQKAALDECTSLQQQVESDLERMEDLESNVSDSRARLARLSRGSDAFKTTEKNMVDLRVDVRRLNTQCLERLQAMGKLLDEAGSEAHIELMAAHESIGDLRALNGRLERENAVLKTRAARNDPLALRFEQDQKELEARARELEEEHLERRQALEVRYREGEVRLKKCQEELLRLREELDGVRRAFDDTALKLRRREMRDNDDGSSPDVDDGNSPSPYADDDGPDARDREVMIAMRAAVATRAAVVDEFRERVSRLEAVNDALTALLGDSANHQAADLAVPLLGTHEQEYRELERHVEPRGAEVFLDVMRRRADILDGRGAAGPLTIGEGQLVATWLELLRAKVLFGHKYRARLWEATSTSTSNSNTTTTTTGDDDGQGSSAAALAWDPFVEADALVRRFESVYEVIPGLPRAGLAGLRLLRAQVALDYLGGDAEQTAKAFGALGLRADGGVGQCPPSSDAALLRATLGWAKRVEQLEERRRRWRAGDKPACQEPRGPCGCRLRAAF
ncbi:hypothetical protein GGTG_00179 [Gaeumannomyces tritici R3-111a-1]|uniref:Uncharacterized protein n=1 Tax=Gaeumannomyces tritici (strain R3-111a-1) TaxID=644352 RepID=J3NFY6_GAET3|nr:hypothetical protein GGTG_00179 [Gaeumannomyces tritici R3-111a-1]EJT80176.1 hypothetical protein GGTG_00179 [Gaeumannomyces tritici R3-111a-1]